MLDTNLTMLIRANRWILVVLLCVGLLLLISIVERHLGINTLRGTTSNTNLAPIKIPLLITVITTSIWVSYRYSLPIWISRTKRAGLSCPVCFHDLRGEPAEAAICPECGMRYTRTGLKRYWKTIIPAYFLRWSDRRLLRECGLSFPGGKPIDGTLEQSDPQRPTPDVQDESGGVVDIARAPHRDRRPVMKSKMLDTSATMFSRANRWFLAILLYIAFWCFNMLALGMSATGISITNGQLSIEPYARLQVPILVGTVWIGAFVTRKYVVPLRISRAKRAGLSCPFCFHDLRDEASEEAACPECGMRYTRTGLKNYWNKIIPAYFLRWSDKKLLRECGLSMPDGDPVD
jgi:uncharacterized Zn-finger protein